MQNWISRAGTNRALKRQHIRMFPVRLAADVYAGRILGAQLQVIDDIAKALGVEPTDDELGVLREGYIARTREQILALTAPVLTPKMTRKLRLEKLRAKRRAERAAAAEATVSEAP